MKLATLNTISKNGFTIIEWLISFFITLLMVTLVFQFSSQFYSRLLVRSQLTNAFSESYAALDHISRHISQAPAQKNKWDIDYSSGATLKWYDQERETKIGYIFKNQKIYFVVNKRKNIMACNIKSLYFSPIIVGGQIKSIKCEITFFNNNFLSNNKIKKLERLIALKNRVIG
ncbi:PilW family protein [Candidatus Dependentiae bacterium]